MDINRRDRISERLVEELDRLRKIFPVNTATDMAAQLNVPREQYNSWRYYHHIPNAYYLSILDEQGVDIKYVITGVRSR